MAAIELAKYLRQNSRAYHACVEACVECLVACEMCAEACRRCEAECRRTAGSAA